MWLSVAKAFFDPASFQRVVNGHESHPPGERGVVTGGVRTEDLLAAWELLRVDVSVQERLWTRRPADRGSAGLKPERVCVHALAASWPCTDNGNPFDTEMSTYMRRAAKDAASDSATAMSIEGLSFKVGGKMAAPRRKMS